MRSIISSALIIIILLVSCKNNEESNVPNVIENQQVQDINVEDISNLKYVDYVLDFKTEEAIKDWQEYYELQSVINEVIKSDLSFFNDNEENINILISKLKENIPAEVKSDGILARLLVLETKLLKLQSLSNLSTTTKEELLTIIKEFFVSFSNVNFQMNKKIEFDNRAIEKP
ncbi:MAG: hypothetical protein HKO01_00465 [Flaviramulus sp.]|nr:hypothetical protein [Flaviramulus sp.]NNC48991.1 hypothetical protein [Flaviramulus sp.]